MKGVNILNNNLKHVMILFCIGTLLFTTFSIISASNINSNIFLDTSTVEDNSAVDYSNTPENIKFRESAELNKSDMRNWSPLLRPTEAELDNRYSKHDFYPTDFVFEYNDKNTSEYEGDTGLLGAYCRNTVDNKTYYLGSSMVRGIAYLTNKTFKLDEYVDVTRDGIDTSDSRYGHCDYRLYPGTPGYSGMYYKNGTQVPDLSISDDHLTKEQKEYFDDYEAQRQEYHNEKMEDYARDQAYNSYSSSYSNKKSSGHFRTYNGYYGHYWSD